MSLILLKHREFCPACFRQNLVKAYGQCRNCGMWLFETRHDTDKFVADTGWREFYVFNSQLGWMHSTQYKSPKALEREYKPEKLPDDYGKKTHEQMAQEAIESAKQKAKEIL
jgi:hypothetical protein